MNPVKLHVDDNRSQSYNNHKNKRKIKTKSGLNSLS